MNDTLTPSPVLEASDIDAYSISEDGSTALIKFKDEDDQPTSLIIPVGKLGALMSVVVNLRRLAEKRNIPAGHLQFTIAQSYSIGNVGGRPDAVLIGFDGGLASEQMFLVEDKPAMGMAEAIKNNIFKRKTRDNAPRPAIILPPGFKQ